MENINQDFEEVYDEHGYLIGFISPDKKHHGKFAKVPKELFYEGRYLTVKAKWVYATLVSFKNNKTGKTFPSYATIMEHSGINRKGDISDALAELERFGWITRTRKVGRSNDYYVGSGEANGSHPVKTLADGTRFFPISPTPAEAANWRKDNSRKNAGFKEYVLDKSASVAEVEVAF